MPPAVRIGFVVVALGAMAASAVNVFADDAAVRSMAEGVGCPRGCKATSVQVERTPFAETVIYMTSTGTITVRCTRAAILVGPYSCVKD